MLEPTVWTGVGDNKLILLQWVESHQDPSERGPHVVISGHAEGGQPARFVLTAAAARDLAEALAEQAREVEQAYEKVPDDHWSGR